MKTFYLTTLIFLLAITYAGAQDFEYGKINGDDLGLNKVTFDSSANAVVIREFGTSRIDLDQGVLSVVFMYHVKIKILNKNGFNHGNIVIPLRIHKEIDDEVEELRATTYNFSSGVMTRIELDKKNIFKEKANKYVNLYKFTMPDLKEGSVIEYSYRVKSPGIFNFRKWDFQSEIPKLHSEYIAFIPGVYNYNVALRGGRKLTTQKSEVSRGCFRYGSHDVNCSKMTYIMKNVPALIEEDYMTSASNFKAAVYFELSHYQDMQGQTKNVTKNWKDIDKEMMEDRAFGLQIKKKELFKDLLPQMLNGATAPLDKARAIYAYIQKNIKWNGYIGINSENTIKTALDRHSGNTADINLALVAALNAADIDAEAFILSTRSNGTVNDLYPVISEFNYVVAKVNIDNKSYLADATVPFLPFGLLPHHCINGKGRAIPVKKPSYWHDIVASQKQSTKYVLNAKLQNDGLLKGSLTTVSSGYSALKKRERISEAGSIDQYVERLDEQMPAVKIGAHTIENLDSLENPLVEIYEIEMKIFDKMGSGQYYLNPFFINRIDKNPFNLNERSYPVDLGAAVDDRLTMNITLPDNVTLSTEPKNMAMALADNGGKYQTATSQAGNNLVFHQLMQLNNPVYSPDDYLSLKEFYSRIIQFQKTDITLKKTK
jgi:transglutaminase-like putative cysteine protease